MIDADERLTENVVSKLVLKTRKQEKQQVVKKQLMIVAG